MEPSPFLVEPAARLSVESQHSQSAILEDSYFAALASAEGDDELDDPDCASVVAAVDAAALELGHALSARVLAAKSTLAQKAQARQAQMQEQMHAELDRLQGHLEKEAMARMGCEARLAKAWVVQNKNVLLALYTVLVACN